MRASSVVRTGGLLAALALGPGLGGCSFFTDVSPYAKVVQAPTTADRECLARAMYFESNRSDEQGLLAVGTVVMNRLDSPKYPDSICGVVGQNRQFAQGVMSKPMREQDRARIERVADAVLSGERHSGVGQAMHFHTTGYTFRYTNMHYVTVAGGNSFYEKTDRNGYLPARVPQAVVQTALGPQPVERVALAMVPTPQQTAASRGSKMPAIAATQLAWGSPALPIGIPTRYTSAPGF